MKFYTYSQVLGDYILYRGYENGHQVIEKVPFKPTLYVNSKNPKSKFRGLYDNKPLEPIEFSDIREARNFIESYKDVRGFEVHGFTKWQYQYINKMFPNDIEYDISQVNIQTIDIEVVNDAEDGFPDIQEAATPIVLISIHNSIDDRTIVLGIKHYEPDENDSFDYIQFDDERAMLRYFVNYVATKKPDVWTGWNTSQFDIPYIVNRLMRLFDESMVKKLSPFGYIREKTIEIRGKEIQTFDVYGIIDLDYLELYKKYGTYSAKESYKLDFIANDELGESKVELPGTSFRDNYNNYFQLFVKYNAIDTILIKKLEKKMKLIELAFAMAYMYKCNINDIYRTVLPWEVFIFNHLSTKNIPVPPKKQGMRGEVEGAWVKESVPGMHGWTMSFDFASLYPSVIRQWKISPETFRPIEVDVRVEDFLTMSPKAIEACNNAKKQNCTVAANGSMYDKSKQGFLPELMQYCMEGRKLAKKEMLTLEQEYQQTKNPSLLPRITALNNKQMALKIAANACYGAIGNEGFHYYDYRMAEAITLTGQLSDKHLAQELNKTFNKIIGTTVTDYVLYGDTDSIYLNCQLLVDKFVADCETDKIVKFLDKFGERVCQPVINKSVGFIYDLMNAYDKVMTSKREAIASRVLFRARKNYAMYVHNSEGVDYFPPKIKVMGIEIVRSSTPQWCRKKLKESLQMIFETNEISFRERFNQIEKEFKSLPASEVAFPRGVTDIDKWFDNGKIKKGAPIHVRAALLYNIHSEKFKNYPKIQNGDRIKFIYLKMPNPIGQDVFGFPAGATIPAELGLDKYIDYNLQFEKTFEVPLKSLTDIVGWKAREESSLEDFF